MASSSERWARSLALSRGPFSVRLGYGGATWCAAVRRNHGGQKRGAALKQRSDCASRATLLRIDSRAWYGRVLPFSPWIRLFCCVIASDIPFLLQKYEHMFDFPQNTQCFPRVPRFSHWVRSAHPLWVGARGLSFVPVQLKLVGHRMQRRLAH